MKLNEILEDNPVIAAIKNDNDLMKVCESSALTVFVLYGDILELPSICSKLKEKGKTVFVHVDLIEGLKGDLAGIKYIKQHTHADGIISTKPTNIKHGNQLGLHTIQRIFVIDSLSLATGIKNINEMKPNAVEVMPGIASKIIKELQKKINICIIAGGLIKEKSDVIEALSAGAAAISTTAEELWNLE